MLLLPVNQNMTGHIGYQHFATVPINQNMIGHMRLNYFDQWQALIKFSCFCLSELSLYDGICSCSFCRFRIWFRFWVQVYHLSTSIFCLSVEGVSRPRARPMSVLEKFLASNLLTFVDVIDLNTPLSYSSITYDGIWEWMQVQLPAWSGGRLCARKAFWKHNTYGIMRQ